MGYRLQSFPVYDEVWRCVLLSSISLLCYAHNFPLYSALFQDFALLGHEPEKGQLRSLARVTVLHFSQRMLTAAVLHLAVPRRAVTAQLAG